MEWWSNGRIARTCLVLLVTGLALMGRAEGKSLNLTFCCARDNDLYSILSKSGSYPRYEAPAEAVEHAKDGSAVLILADGYPETTTVVPPEVLDRAREKNLRLYIEYPDAGSARVLTGNEVGAPQHTVWERAVVSSDAFGEELPKLHIVGVQDCHFVPMKASDPMLVVAKVAGFDTAVFGLPENAFPLLFEVPDRNLLVATTKLSGFVTGRYAPTHAWKVIWAHILTMLAPENPSPALPATGRESPARTEVLPPRCGEGWGGVLRWTPTVHPAYGRDDKLPRDFERKAFDAAADWVFDSRLLIHPSREAEIHRLLAQNIEGIEEPGSDAPTGDGSLGILEGYSAAIKYDGSQVQRLPIRSDCHAETAAVLALDSMLNGDDRSGKTASNLLDYVYFTSGMCGGVRGNPKHPAYGLIAWGNVSRAWEVASYSDDDGRVMLGTMLTSACLGSKKWDEPLLRALLANLRTTGPQGFRGDRIDMPPIESVGWKHFHDTERVNYSTHHESYLWACNIWAYGQTGYKPFIERTKTAIRMTMEAFPDGWRWNDSMERARMLLCLSWLVRIEDTPEHREWLDRIAQSIISYQQPSGAIDERRGGELTGFQIAMSNEEYGTGETPLIQQNGDPVTDQLYTTGFALLGLHEGYAATGDPKLKASEDKLAEFLCRIQVRSEKYPYLDGTWFRAFDHRQWDYWASSGDVGWGAWSVEAGWAQAWTAVVLALRQKGTSMWEMTAGSRIIDHWDAVREQMKQNDGGPWTGAPWKGSRE